jgi:hypothetical protein
VSLYRQFAWFVGEFVSISQCTAAICKYRIPFLSNIYIQDITTMASNGSMKKIQSEDELCMTKQPAADAERVLSPKLVIALLGVAAYVMFLMRMSEEFKAEAEVLPYSDPFKQIWWSAPGFFTVAT